jgi:hypothetical protein
VPGIHNVDIHRILHLLPACFAPVEKLKSTNVNSISLSVFNHDVGVAKIVMNDVGLVYFSYGFGDTAKEGIPIVID